jgi:hypothetical protein
LYVLFGHGLAFPRGNHCMGMKCAEDMIRGKM